jgi:hypothetical protein
MRHRPICFVRLYIVFNKLHAACSLFPLFGDDVDVLEDP